MNKGPAVSGNFEVVDLSPPHLFKREIARPQFRHRVDGNRASLVAPAPQRIASGGFASAGLILWAWFAVSRIAVELIPLGGEPQHEVYDLGPFLHRIGKLASGVEKRADLAGARPSDPASPTEAAEEQGEPFELASESQAKSFGETSVLPRRNTGNTRKDRSFTETIPVLNRRLMRSRTNPSGATWVGGARRGHV